MKYSGCKKLTVSIIVAAMTLVTATCFAKISISDLNIGGIYYGQPWSELVSKYGEPIRKEPRAGKGFNNVFMYGNSTFLANSNDNGVYFVSIGKNCPLATYAGIKIGSTQADIQAVYGKPDKISNTQYGGYSLNYSAGRQSRDMGNGRSYDIEPMLFFKLDRPNGRVTHFWFDLCEYWDDPYPTGSRPKTSTQQNPPKSQQQQKPKSTIPAFVAEIPKTELNIGGINPGQSMDYVEQIYGSPAKVLDEGFFKTYNYNDLFVVKGKLNNGFKVTSVASYEKGLKMPNGLMVGDLYENVVKKFGVVKGIKFKGEGVEAKFKGCTDYTYFSGDKQMVFIVDKKGVVVGIRAEDIDEQKFIESKRAK